MFTVVLPESVDLFVLLNKTNLLESYHCTTHAVYSHAGITVGRPSQTGGTRLTVDCRYLVTHSIHGIVMAGESTLLCWLRRVVACMCATRLQRNPVLVDDSNLHTLAQTRQQELNEQRSVHCAHIILFPFITIPDGSKC